LGRLSPGKRLAWEETAKWEAEMAPQFARMATDELFVHPNEVDATRPKCFRSNPGAEVLTPERKKRLEMILASKKRDRKATRAT
jgi:hypothetical protein